MTALLLCIAASARGQYDPDWATHFRLGAMVGFNIKADFKITGPFSLAPGPAGVYDDGYVVADPFTSSDPQHLTTAFGYSHASQYNAAANELTMHRTTSYSGSATASADGGAFPGFDLAYGCNLWYWGRFRIGWDFGFGLLPIKIESHDSFSADVTQQVTVYDTSGVILPPGGYSGPRDGSGTVSIPFNPKSSASAASVGIVSGTHTLDVILYGFRLGPSVYWDFNPHLGMSVSAGPAMGVVSGSLKFDETISTSSVAENHGSVDGTEVVFGGYVNASVMYHAMKNGDIYLSAQFMPLGDATISGGGRSGRLDLSGQVYISAGVNWPF